MIGNDVKQFREGLVARVCAALAIGMAAALLVGCSDSPKGPEVGVGAISAAPASTNVGTAPVVRTATGAALPVSGQERGYSLGPGDKLRILVFNENEMSREYEVDTAGKVTLPLVGAMQAAGKTPSELQEAIRNSLKQGFIRDPKVSIEVLTYRPFYIIGEVTKAGEYPYKNGMNVVSAVAVAGGYSYRAATDKVYIRRANETIERPFEASPGIQVQPGDIIRIPERYF